MPELNPLSNEQIFLKKIAENTGSDYNTGDVSEINPITIDQILLKEIAANTAGQSGDITELEEKVSATQDMLSDAYDSTHTYNVSDYCIYENSLYKCNTASTTGTWDSSKWDAVTVADELGVLEGMFESYNPTLTYAGAGSTIIAYRIGRLVVVNVKWILDTAPNIEITGLPLMSQTGVINNGFGIIARDQSDGSLVRMWTNGSSDILTGSDTYTIGHPYGISYSYLTD